MQPTCSPHAASPFATAPPPPGQAPERVAFEVLSLERRVEGSNVPLPKALIKSLLNMVLPPVRGPSQGAVQADEGARVLAAAQGPDQEPARHGATPGEPRLKTHTGSKHHTAHASRARRIRAPRTPQAGRSTRLRPGRASCSPTATAASTPEQVFTRLLLGAVPHELGQYVLESGEAIDLALELRIRGE